MRTRRLPSGGLAALAVVLAALAVVVVAGAPAPRTVVERITSSTRTVRHHEGTAHRHPHHRDVIVTVVGTPVTHVASRTSDTPPPRHRASKTRRPATTTPSAPTTTTSVPVTTTTSARRALPTSRGGVFEGGQTTATEWLGAVRSVTVLVPEGVRVTLSVTCGFATSPTRSEFTSVTVRVQGGGASCAATFGIPASSPQPAPWRLVTS
jgi:hypothetical protein